MVGRAKLPFTHRQSAAKWIQGELALCPTFLRMQAIGCHENRARIDQFLSVAQSNLHLF
jgi:hypothetical protein